MDNSLTNLMNESQCLENKYVLELNITETNRKNIKLILFIIGFALNFIVLFINNVITNILIYITALLCIFSGINFIYKNNNYIKENAILFSVYLVSIIFEFILIINNDSNLINILSLLITMLYQIIYITNFE